MASSPNKIKYHVGRADGRPVASSSQSDNREQSPTNTPTDLQLGGGSNGCVVAGVWVRGGINGAGSANIVNLWWWVNSASTWFCIADIALPAYTSDNTTPVSEVTWVPPVGPMLLAQDDKLGVTNTQGEVIVAVPIIGSLDCANGEGGQTHPL